jgi:23S rRNA (cytosine1962-C5)-methyltransferase
VACAAERWALLQVSGTQGSGTPLSRALEAAAAERDSLLQGSDALRLHDADRDSLRGLTVERYASFAVVNAYAPEVHARRNDVANALLAMGAKGVYYKLHSRADLRLRARTEFAPSQPLAGQAHGAELRVREHEMAFQVRLGDGLSTGLFIDQRDNRRRVAADCRGARVLNLFAYTCSFSVAAGMGGAAQVVSVDLSKSALERGHANLALNGLDSARHRLLKADVRKWLARAAQRRERFDWIILDPPNFATVGRDIFRVRDEYAQLASACVELLANGGRLLAVLNHRGTSSAQHAAWVSAAFEQQRRTLAELSALPAAPDCASEGNARTKSVLARAGSS